jgi:hypothetical protein
MDITPQDDSQQSISDDQELAKALAGVLPDVPEPVVAETTPDQIENMPVLPPVEPISELPQPTAFAPASFDATPTSSSPSDLESIKKDALNQLRPLIDKVNLPAEEKFDTYLMLIRSTDDSSLIAPAHAVAQAITDESRRAEALLDIIKEIDYLSRNNQQPTV